MANGYSVAFPIAIWRCTNNGDTESNLDNNEEIGLDDGFSEASQRGCTVYTWRTSNRQTDVAQPSGRGLSKPDTGIGGLQLIIGIKLNEKIAWDKYELILTKWALEKQVVKGSFEKARFGIRNDKKNFPNFQPTTNSGFMIVENSSEDQIEFAGMFDVLMTFQYAGDPSELVAIMNGYIPPS